MLHYNFVSQPSKTNAGGVGFYIRNHLNYLLRSDISCSYIDFEALWIEIETDSHRNMLCGVLYRHPNGNLENFMSYLNSTSKRIHQESKYCVIMGDFNLDLLNGSSPCYGSG